MAITAALSWAGVRLIEQQRAIDGQRAVQELENVAGSIVAGMRERLASAGEHLGASVTGSPGASSNIDGAVVLTVTAGTVRVSSPASVPFVPSVGAPSATNTIFAEGEALEFIRGDLPAAARTYRTLATQRDAAVRADALLRLGRALRKAGDFKPALLAYQELTMLGAVRVGDLPAEFAGLYGQRATLRALGDKQREGELTERLARGIDEGRWLLTRGVAEHDRDDFGAGALPESWALADALDRVWSESRGVLPPHGQRLFSNDDGDVLVMWRAGGVGSSLMAAFVDDFFRWRVPNGIEWQLTDSEGRRIAGARASPASAVTRLVGDAEYPWTLHVAPGSAWPGRRSNDATLIAMMGATLLFLWGTTYFMARAIRREAAVARLQSDFVAAVTHEFRSPLTTIRQMAEMLEMGRLATEERRQTYYRVLAGEATRLQRLVETLLNFGRMEAGATSYRFADVDAATLVRGVVRDIEPVALDAGKRIEVSGPDEEIRMHADEHALSVALRNLIDNAIKYSPDVPSVQVEWHRHNGHAAIHVIDRGVGIPRAEQRVIFRKFVRGRSAIDTNVKGTGVGLSMVQQIVVAHGGEIQLESRVGHGSTFTMLLPVAQ